jgi:hypothetical protein
VQQGDVAPCLSRLAWLAWRAGRRGRGEEAAALGWQGACWQEQAGPRGWLGCWGAGVRVALRSGGLQRDGRRRERRCGRCQGMEATDPGRPRGREG